jgi:hypothetical protein
VAFPESSQPIEAIAIIYDEYPRHDDEVPWLLNTVLAAMIRRSWIGILHSLRIQSLLSNPISNRAVAKLVTWLSCTESYVIKSTFT